MSDKQLKSKMSSVPIWKKMNLTVEEASEYSGMLKFWNYAEMSRLIYRRILMAFKSSLTGIIVFAVMKNGGKNITTILKALKTTQIQILTQ